MRLVGCFYGLATIKELPYPLHFTRLKCIQYELQYFCNEFHRWQFYNLLKCSVMHMDRERERERKTACKFLVKRFKQFQI